MTNQSNRNRPTITPTRHNQIMASLTISSSSSSRTTTTFLSRRPRPSPTSTVRYPASPISLSLRQRFRSNLTVMASAAVEMKGGKKLFVSDTEEDLSVQLAKYTADLSAKFAAERGTFTVVLSGGSLINSLRKLTEPPYLESVDWARWHVFWVDERVVPKDHQDSNYLLALNGLLSKVPIPTGQVYAINDALSPEGAADDYEACLKQLVNKGIIAMSAATGFPKFDLMLLGMGPDGHVASLFPGHPLVNEKERWVTFIKDSPKPPPERITFTFPVINSSAYIALVVTGAGKAGAVHKALSDNQASSDLLPVEMISLQDGEFTWFTDKTAVLMLQDKTGP